MKKVYAKALKEIEQVYTNLTGEKTHRQKKEHLVAVWLPVKLLRELDRATAVRDSDRSKFIREAIRRAIDNAKLER